MPRWQSETKQCGQVCQGHCLLRVQGSCQTPVSVNFGRESQPVWVAWSLVIFVPCWRPDVEDGEKRLVRRYRPASRYSSLLTVQVELQNEQCKEHIAITCRHPSPGGETFTLTVDLDPLSGARNRVRASPSLQRRAVNDRAPPRARAPAHVSTR
eukprot:COSAG02_NODE_5701_length_4110_cov_2.049115_1_plen_153_part_10